MSKPRLLDLFCGAGGTSMGYHRAGFEVEGVDIKPQSHYPFKFYQADALTFPLEGYDAYHASPPCQAYISFGYLDKSKYPDLIAKTRELLRATNKPYVIENIPGAKRLLENPIILCGKSFGLKVYRHRCFECSFSVKELDHISHHDSTPGAGYGISPKGFISIAGHMNNVAYAKQAMDIDWMNGGELSQAIPPAYTEYIGKYLMKAVVEIKWLK